MGRPNTLSLSQVVPGMEFEEVVYGPLTREDFVRYAEASGDDNPIHQDEANARSQGAPTVFAMGMLNAGLLGHALSDWIGGPQHLKRYKVRFTTRVWAGDELVCSGRVESIEGNVVTVKVEARRRGRGPEGLGLAEEETAIVGEADVELAEEGV